MYVICGRNVALAVYSSYEAASLSLQWEGYSTRSPGTVYSEWTNGRDTLTLVYLTQDTPSDEPTPLFRAPVAVAS